MVGVPKSVLFYQQNLCQNSENQHSMGNTLQYLEMISSQNMARNPKSNAIHQIRNIKGKAKSYRLEPRKNDLKSDNTPMSSSN